jgi:hypothetical protein
MRAKGVGAESFVRVLFGKLAKIPEFHDRSVRDDLRARLSQIPGVEIAEERLDTSVAIPATRLRSVSAQDAFIASLDWAVQRVGPVGGQAAPDGGSSAQGGTVRAMG